MDFNFSDLLAALNVSSGLAAIYGAGAILLAVGFASWLVDMIASWFNSHDDSDEEDDGVSGDEVWGEDAIECDSCGWSPQDVDSFYHAVNEGYCPKCGE